MKKEDLAFCGLNCDLCKSRFLDIREKIKILDEAFEKVNMAEVSKVIPFMKSKYRGYKKLAASCNHVCPGCRNKGGNPFCGIRKCATKKGYFTCAECDSLCKKFNLLFKVHVDNEIQCNIEHIRTKGIDSLIEAFIKQS